MARLPEGLGDAGRASVPGQSPAVCPPETPSLGHPQGGGVLHTVNPGTPPAEKACHVPAAGYGVAVGWPEDPGGLLAGPRGRRLCWVLAAGLVVMGKTTPVPHLDVLGELAIKAARNARRLLDDAELLLRRGRWPTAYSVAVLAFEEAGKAWLCVIAMMVPDDTRQDYPFAGMIGAHLDKLMAAHAMAHMHAFIKGGTALPRA